MWKEERSILKGLMKPNRVSGVHSKVERGRLRRGTLEKTLAQSRVDFRSQIELPRLDRFPVPFFRARPAQRVLEISVTVSQGTEGAKIELERVDLPSPASARTASRDPGSFVDDTRALIDLKAILASGIPLSWKRRGV